MTAPLILLTNDDGYDCAFLTLFAEALESAGFRLAVAAPQHQQSWIGRAYSRHRPVGCKVMHSGSRRVWALDGTPSDCVNIALAHLLGERPAAVVSGINIGFNCTTPLVFSSGTLAGAIEGCQWGIPSAAFSLELTGEQFRMANTTPTDVQGSLRETLKRASVHAVRFVRELLAAPAPAYTVDNVNFPCEVSAEAPVVRTVPSAIMPGSLFMPTAEGSFSFAYPNKPFRHDPGTDVACLKAGNISHTRFDFRKGC